MRLIPFSLTVERELHSESQWAPWDVRRHLEHLERLADTQLLKIQLEKKQFMVVIIDNCQRNLQTSKGAQTGA